MQQKIVFWVPGDNRLKQYWRMQVILSPVLTHLRRLGVQADFAAMLSDPLDSCAGDVNIWLATELGEAPPTPGRNILWFLSQMKITPHTVLLAHDAIFTASRDHFQFLQAWIGHIRPIGQLGWPLPKITKPPAVPRQKEILLDYIGTDSDTVYVRQSRLPADAQELADFLGQYDVIKTNPILRERMCGFYGFEELVAAAAGCRIESLQRQGLAPALAPYFLGHGPVQPDSVDLDAFCAACDPGVIAQRIFETVALISTTAPARQNEIAEGGGDISTPEPKNISEVDAFFRDCDYVLKTWHGIAPTLAHIPPVQTHIATPWNSAISQPTLASLAPKPWTNLSLARAMLQQIQAGTYHPSAEDCSRLRDICNILHRFIPSLTTRALPLQEWPLVPWTRVADECKDIKRDYIALSRALNGHNIYRFSQAITVKKTLSPLISDSSAYPAQFLSKTGIFMHAFYMEVAKDILEKIHGHLSTCPIFITTNTEEKRSKLLDILRQCNWPIYRVDVVPNRGRDVYPKLFHMAADHAQFEFVLHLHTKKSPHSSSLAFWGMQTVETLAGDFDKLGQIAHAFQTDPRLGMVYADPPENLHPAMSWTRDLRLAEVLAATMGLPSLPDGDDLDFPVGSMFWARCDALHLVQNCKIDLAHFVPEDAQEDGTLAHALERVLGAACWARGYHMARCIAKSN
jgi:hypothetical protein